MSDKTEIRINRNLTRWILLGVGLLALVVAFVAWIAIGVEGDRTVPLVALGVAVAGIAGFVLMDPEAISKALTGRTGQQATLSVLMTLFFILAVGVGYYILYQLDQEESLDWDLTENQRYRISDESIEILQGLEEPVKAYAFYSSTDRGGREEAEQLLQQYAGEGGDNFDYEFVDPDLEPIEAQRLGVTRPGVIIIEQGDRTAEAAFADESTITSAIARVQLGDPQKAYLLTGHGERGLDDPAQTGLTQAAALMQRANYTVEPLNLAGSEGVPDDASVVIIPGPSAQLSQGEIDALDAYLQDGGSLLVLADPGQTGGVVMGNGVLGIDWSDDNDVVATAGADGSVRIWDADSGEETQLLRGHTADVLSVALSPDGSRAVTASRDGTVRVWDTESGEELATLAGQTALARRVAWSPDGNLIASAGEDQVINVWDANSFEPMAYSPLVTTVPLYAVEFSPDSSLIAAGGGRAEAATGGPVLVWEAASGEELVNRNVHTYVVNDVGFTSDGDQVISAAVDGTVGTTDIDGGQSSTETLYPELGISALAVLNEDTVLLGLYDGSMHLHELGTDAADDTLLEDGHTDVVWDLAAAPGGEQFASAGRDGVALIWNDDREVDARLEGHGALDPLQAYLSEQWGITLGNDLVIDLVGQQYFQNPVTPVVQDYSQTSPVTSSLVQEQLPTVFPLSRSVSVGTAPETVTLEPILFTNAQQGISWAETTDPFGTAGQVDFDEADIPGPITLGVAGTNNETDARVIVIGDADFISNEGLGITGFGNTDLFTGALNWLADVDAGVDIPPADLGGETWDEPLPLGGLRVLQFLSCCGIPGLLLLMGAAVWFVRKRRR